MRGNMIKQIKSCFANEAVNLGRQRELDIAKGISIVFMIFCHSYEMLAQLLDPAASTDLSYMILDVILGGSLAAPVFVFCMGISFAYSRNSGAGDMVRRAVRMIGIAVLLEIFYIAIPGAIEWLITKDPECIEYAYMLLCADILQFSALSMLVIALFKKLKLKPAVMVIISVICSIVGQLLQYVSTGSYFGDVAVGFLWHSYDYSYFPLLNWLIFPVCGYAFSSAWQRLENKDKFFRVLTPISWVITVVYFVSMVFLGEYYLSGGDYYGMGILDAAIALVICCAMIGLGYYLKKLGGRIGGWLESMGSRVTSIYCIHWVCYCTLYLILLCVLEDYLSQLMLLPASVLVLIVSDILSRIYVNFKRKNKKN